MPVIAMVVLAYTSFFISRQAAPARVALGVISFLTINQLTTEMINRLPPFQGAV